MRKLRYRGRYQMGGYYGDPEEEMRNDQIDSSLAGGVSAINPLWGALAKVGVAGSDKIRGEGTNDFRSITGDIANPFNQFKNNENIGDWALSFGLPGISSIVKGQRLAKEARKNKLHAEYEKSRDMENLYKADTSNYDFTGRQDDSSIYALGGHLKQLNSNTVEAEGRTHAEGGIKIPDAEVEDNETISGDYVFSDVLGFADKHKPIAKQIGTIERKPLNRERRVTLEILRKKEHALKLQQEAVKSELLGGDTPQYQLGGTLQNSLTTGSALTEPEGVPALSYTDWRSGNIGDRDWDKFPLSVQEINGWSKEITNRRQNRESKFFNKLRGKETEFNKLPNSYTSLFETLRTKK